MKLPDSCDKNYPYRLVFTWHQLGGSTSKIINGEDPNSGGALPYYGLQALANDSSIFVVPDGINAGWANQGGEDVTFGRPIGCEEGYPITWVIHDGDHNPSQVDQGSSTPFAPQNTWEFFSQFS